MKTTCDEEKIQITMQGSTKMAVVLKPLGPAKMAVVQES